MTNKTNTKDNTGGVNPIIAGVTGAVIGAGIAIAGAVMLKDEKNRDKAKKVLKNVKDGVGNYVKDLEKSVQKKSADVEEKLAKGMKKAKNLADSTGKKLHAKAKEATKASKK